MGAKKQFILTSTGLQNLQTQEFETLDVTKDDPAKLSLFGTPIWSNLIFNAGSYVTLEGDEIELEEVELDSVLLSVSQSKTIVTTAVQGKSSTVKEYISEGDFTVSIAGVLVGEGADVYPEQEFLNLLEQLRAPVSLKITSEFLSLFDIDEIVVTGFDAPQKFGSRNTQIFTINAISDEPIELREVNSF